MLKGERHQKKYIFISKALQNKDTDENFMKVGSQQAYAYGLYTKTSE